MNRFLWLFATLYGCSDDSPPDKKIAASVAQIPAAEVIKSPKDLRKVAYLRQQGEGSMGGSFYQGSSMSTWNLSEIASFNVYAKNQIEKIKDIKNNNIRDDPFFKNAFLTQVYGLASVLTYMRLTLNVIQRGDTANIRMYTLESADISDIARDVTQAGEMMILFNRIRASYLKINDLASRELLKNSPPAPQVTEEIRLSVLRSVELSRVLLDNFDLLMSSENSSYEAEMNKAIDELSKLIEDTRSRTIGMNNTINMEQFFELQTMTQQPQGNNMLGPVNPNFYGELPTADQLLRAGAPPFSPQNKGVSTDAQHNLSTQPSTNKAGNQQGQTMNFSPPPAITNPAARYQAEKLNSASLVEADLSNDIVSKPSYNVGMSQGNQPPATPTPTSQAGSLPSPASLIQGLFSGAPQAQPAPPPIPTQAPPPPTPPPPPPAK